MTNDETDVNKYNNGEWHGWNGGDCPVHPNSEVYVMFNSGEVARGFNADEWDWSHNISTKLVAFRVTKPYVESKEPREFWITSGTLGYVHVKTEKPSDMYGYIHVKEVLED